MARPVVLVYQDFATTTVTPETPDLNCMLVGPAYWIKDYLDDKGDIQAASNYGTKDANNPYTPPAPSTAAITIAEPPGNKIGALLDSTSVKVYFDECRVLIAQDVTTGVAVTQFSNKIDTTGSPLVLTDIKAGDYIVIQDPAGGGTDLPKRVLSVDADNNAIYATTNFAATASTKFIRVEREVSDVLVDSSFLYISGNSIEIQGGVTTLLTGESVPRTVDFAKVYVQYRSLRQDLRAIDTVSSETDITSKVGKVDSRNPLAGTLATALKNTITPIQFFGVASNDASGHGECLEIMGSRKDVYAVVPLVTDKSILATYNTQFTQLASPSHAETTGIPQKWRVVLGAQALPLTQVVSPSSGTYFSNGNHKSVDGAVANTPITLADDINVFYDATADFLSAGVRAGDTLVIAADTVAGRKGTYTVAAVYDAHRLRTTTAFASTNGQSGTSKYYIIRGTGTPFTLAGTPFTGGDCANTGQLVTTVGVTGATDHAGKVLRLTTPAGNAGDWLITAVTNGPPAIYTVAHPTKTLADNTAGTAGSLFSPLCASATGAVVVTRRCFRVIKSATAAHQTDLVKAGDTLEVPNPVSGSSFTTVFSHTVAYIPNENDIVLAANEDVEATLPATGDTNLKFRINRTMSKDDQVRELVSISQSFSSRRTILLWPDSVQVAGLVDGSKDRAIATEPEAADPQPGYYLAAVVGGLTAGLPSHQGLTNLGIAGIDTLYHSTRYFSDEQLTTLSDGGWFVFVQDTPSALPYCLHQLTTDPDTLETGEYSVVKNFDFISMFFMDLLVGFLGQYNVTDETIGLLHQSLNSGIDLLKLRKYAKIGAPLISGTVTSVAQSTAAADRVEAYVNVQLPKPLNRIGLHLISV